MFENARPWTLPHWRGARLGQIRWSIDLGLGRHEANKDMWWWRFPDSLSPPLVRSDGVVITSWQGIVRAHAEEDGRVLWEHDCVLDPEDTNSSYWGEVLYVDHENGTWVLTRDKGLIRIDPNGHPVLVNPELRASGGFIPAPKVLPWGGFVTSYGTDDGYYTRHWPCHSSVVEVMDAEGRVRVSHSTPLAPNKVFVIGRRIVAFFFDESANFENTEKKTRKELALVLDENGEIVDRYECANAPMDWSWPPSVLQKTAKEQGISLITAGMGHPYWYDHTPVPAPSGKCTYASWPEWGSAVRLLRFRDSSEEPEEVTRYVSADEPTVDAEDVCFVTQLRENALWLVGWDESGERMACKLLDNPKVEKYHYAQYGRPKEFWVKMRWFYSPTGAYANGGTLVITALDKGCQMYLVE